MKTSFREAVATALSRANAAFPFLKRLVPRRAIRWVVLHVMRANDGYREMLRSNPERVFLNDEAMPWVARTWRRVLFVGTAPYTYHYERLFADDAARYHTIDKNPAARIWGSNNHMLASIVEVDGLRPEGFFDCVVMNGVLSYRIPVLNDFGVEERELDRLAGAMHRVIRPGGLLLVGWNLRDRPESPFPHFESRFERASTPWGVRREFAGDPHVFEFYTRRAD
ncbi:MAG: class I SAM-dependent methyltransferase [Enhydrobacter sp.]|nr:MAG: class I SAM-dependent methyltransferase [Enhydrobacter sp.]